jgi:mono/diheme cytochrome c family protein
MVSHNNLTRNDETLADSRGAGPLGLAICLCVLALALGCDAGDSAEVTPPPAKLPELANPERPPAQIPPPQATGPSSAEASGNQHDPEEGRAIYALVCVICHGEEGNGEGVATEQFMVTPVRHDDGAYMNQLSNDYLFKIIRDGGTAVGKSPDMKPWSEFYSDDQIWSLVRYVRSLAQPPFDGPMP